MTKFLNHRHRLSIGPSIVPRASSIYLLLFLATAYHSRSSPSVEAALWIVLLSATISSIAGFAFSPIAGALLIYLNPDPLAVVRILLVASIAMQFHCVWQIRSEIRSLEFLPYTVAGLVTLPLGVLLLLRSQASIYLPILGSILLIYGAFIAIKPTTYAHRSNPLMGRILVGALGGITGGFAAFPGAFVVIWSHIQGFQKDRQRSIVQPFILINQLAAATVLFVVRPAEIADFDMILWAAPALLGAHWGLKIFKNLSTVGFNRVVGIALASAGVLMAAKAI